MIEELKPCPFAENLIKLQSTTNQWYTMVNFFGFAME